jgi:hypothetical protein
MRRVRQSLVLQHKCRMSRFLRLRQQREGRYQGSDPDAGTMAPDFSGLGRVRPAALAALAVEIAKQEAVTVKPGGANNPEGRKAIDGLTCTFPPICGKSSPSCWRTAPDNRRKR